jgi:rRNA maturation RNase YbeY
MNKKRDITILSRQSHYKIDKNFYKQILESLMKSLAPEADEISLLLTDDKRMKNLNTDYRGLRSTTDVLSFPGGPKNLEGKINLGDIIVSVQRARAQAREAGWTVKKEIERLIVHGFLHLLGYKHKDKVMRDFERKYLKHNMREG